MKKLITVAIAAFSLAMAAFAATHTVGKGENDYTIAKKYGITVEQLHRLNPEVNWNRLQVGQKVTVSKAAAPKAAAKPAPKPSPKPSPKPRAQVVGMKVSGKTAKVAKSDVILRNGPGTDFDRIARLNKGQSAEVVEFKDNWYKIRFESGTTGWIRRDMVSVTDSAPVATAKPAALPNTPDSNARPTITNVEPAKSAEEPAKPAATPLKVEITGDDVNVRKDCSTSAPKIVTVDKGRVADVLQQKNGWYKVKFAHGTIGWVHGDFVRPTSPTATDPAPKPKAAPAASGSAAALISTAKDQMGVPYSWGGTSRGGFDCSGFVQYVFAKHGVNLPRTSISQSQIGQKVAREDLQPGDLIFFITRGSRVSHVGIFIGNGQFIHASSGGGQVRIDNLSKDYYNKRYAGARRVGKFNSGVLDTARKELGQKAIPEYEGPNPDLP